MNRCYVLTCAPGSRLQEVAAMFDRMETLPENRVIVTTQPDPITSAAGNVLLFDSDEINISKWWTVGLDWIAADAEARKLSTWDVFVIESDVRVERGALAVLRTVLRDTDVAMVGADWHKILSGPREVLWHSENVVPRPPRLPGVALLVRGELGIRHDPEFRWWFADDDFELQHRAAGGTILVGGVHMEHDGSTAMTGARKEFAVEDEVKFLRKWGLTANLPG